MTPSSSPRVLLAAASGLALLAAPGTARAQYVEYPTQEQYVLRVEYREFRPGLQAEVRNGTAEREGTLLDLGRDLGIEDERTFEVRGAIQIKRGWKLRGSYVPLEYRADVPEARRDFVYGSTQYEKFERVVSSFKGGYYSASLEWDFVRGARGFMGVTAGARMLDIDSAVAAPAQGRREVDTVRSPVPALGLISRVYTGRLSLETELGGFSLGNRGRVTEFELGARMHVSDRLAAHGGYRRISMKGKEGRDEADIKLNGWVFGVELSL